MSGSHHPSLGPAEGPARRAALRLPIILVGPRPSRGGDGVGLGVAVGEDLEEVDEVGLLRGGQPEVAHLAVRRHRTGDPLGGRLGGGEAGDVLDVVEDLGRREERRVPDRRSDAEVEGDLLPVAFTAMFRLL